MKNKMMLIPILALLLMAVPTVLALDVDIDGDDVTSTTIDFDIDDGYLNILARGIDTSSWHPGMLGNENTFTGYGSFTGTYSVSQGTYGGLAARINADSSSYARFEFNDYQDFNVLSGNHIYDVKGWFGAYAEGDEDVTMNLKTAGSMYVWSEATNPWSADPLGGNMIGKYAHVEKDDVTQAHLEIDIETDGYATMYNSNIWGWGISESGSAYMYGGGIRTISATGDGDYWQSGFGLDYLEYNGFELPEGGSMSTLGFFDDGFSGEYSMEGN